MDKNLRPEYPRPILQRERWLSLNGEWQFAAQDVAVDDNAGFDQTILVPFAINSDLSSLVGQDVPNVVCYQRMLDIPDEWRGSQILLHIGACDFESRIYINGHQVGQNRGGYAPIAVEISSALKNDGSANILMIRVEDGLSWSQPRGKQEGTTRWPIDYDPIIGIWQSVWLEPVASVFIQDLAMSYQCDGGLVSYTVGLSHGFDGVLCISIKDADSILGSIEVATDGRAEIKCQFPVEDADLWSPASPRLYDVVLDLKSADGDVIDTVNSYIGLREIISRDGKILLNGAPLYIRGILDQGYFPEGWYTAASDAALRKDVQLTKELGFNCARKHQKAEDPRYLYWADKLGLLVWSEMPSGRIFSTDLVMDLTNEWMRLIKRDRAHPCVMAWVPFNESWGVWHQPTRPQQRAFVDGLVGLTKALDSSRLVIGNDGWEYSCGDLWTLHLYEGMGQPISERLKVVLDNPFAELYTDGRVGALPGADVSGLPVLLTECGGVGFVPEGYDSAEQAFAYGEMPATKAALEANIRKIADDIQGAKALCGFVWTQLTDIQQEINGLLTFNREPKLELSVMREIFENIGSEN